MLRPACRLAAAARGAASVPAKVLRRGMGGGGGHGHADHGHHGSVEHLSEGAARYAHLEPTFAAQGAGPSAHSHGHGGRHAEGWEPYHAFFLVGTAVVAWLATHAPNTNPHDWARDEVEERHRRAAEGKEVHYGVNYAAIRYMREKGVLTDAQAEELEGGAVTAPYKVPVNRG